MKKRALTLLEVVIAMGLLGILLTGLFSTLHQILKKQISARALQQKVLQLELFEQRIKTLFLQEKGIWVAEHPEAIGPCLRIHFEGEIDPDWEMSGEKEASLFLNSTNELCLNCRSKKGKLREEVLLNKVKSFQCSVFDSKKVAWEMDAGDKALSDANMVRIHLQWNDGDFPFVFFLKPEEKILYGTQKNLNLEPDAALP